MSQQQPVRSHVFGFVRQEVGQAVRRLIVAVLAAVVLGALAVEAASAIMTQAWPTLPAHVAAIIAALVVGYAAAITVLFRALLRAIGRSAEWVTNEMDQATKRILHENEPSPLAGRQRVYAAHAVSAVPAQAATVVSAGPGGPTLEDGVLTGLRP